MMVSGIRWRIKEKTKTHLNIILNCMSGTMQSELKHFPLANKHNNMRLLKTKLLIQSFSRYKQGIRINCVIYLILILT